jgi:hypothetical protein
VAEQMNFNAGDNIRWKLKVVKGEMRLYIEKGDKI